MSSARSPSLSPSLDRSKMRAWWKGRTKSKSKSASSTPRKKDDGPSPADPPPPLAAPANCGKSDKASSFDEALIARASRELSPISRGCGRLGLSLGHPLPRPSSDSSPPTPVTCDRVAGAGSASASASSISSSGSSEDTPDLAAYRYPIPVNVLRGRNVVSDSPRHHHVVEDNHLFSCGPVQECYIYSETSVSPRREFDHSPREATHSHGRISPEALFSARTPSLSPCSRGNPLPTSPVHPTASTFTLPSPIRRQEDIRNSLHPLPLPPNSPGSSCFIQSGWKKGKLLGRGTFGHVFLGFNSESGQMCAIKEVEIISDDSNSKECLKQLNQEITLLSQLSYPNIVQYHGSELVDDVLSVYLEYVSGGSIRKLLDVYGPFKEPVIRNYSGQILSGLAYLHGRDTVHRDIKGANILVGPNGEVKLADFGMAKHISSYTSIRSFKGSPYWMAPEVIMNKNGYNLSVDIWSLGCTVIEMATSKPPWFQYEGVAAIFKIANGKDVPEIPDSLSVEGKSFLRLCLQRDPGARPTAVHLMDHPFVRDQPAVRAARSSLMKDTSRSFLDGGHTMVHLQTFPGSPSNRSLSPQQDPDIQMRDMARFSSAFPSSCTNTRNCPRSERAYCAASSPSILTPTTISRSDRIGTRTNMSLPVSPCSSPLPQFRQSNRSCLGSPLPAYSSGATSYSPTVFDPWHETVQLNTRSPYGSPRRL